MKNKLTILIYPYNAVGHINSIIGIADVLRTRGHKIVFIVHKSFKDYLDKYEFENEVLEPQINFQDEEDNLSPVEKAANYLIVSGLLSSISTLEKMKILSKHEFIGEMVDRMAATEPQIKTILDKHKPDIIINDQFISSPTLLYSGKPWVNIYSPCPVGIEDDMTPPIGSGYATDSHMKGWIEFKRLYEKYFSIAKYNEYLKANGFPVISERKVMPESPFLNIYLYPKELDYTDIRPVPDKWFAVDSFMRRSEEAFELPVQLKGWERKLIYLSLGSMGSADIELMKRLVNILSKSKHKFIVSKGLLGDKYELADNMWGQRSVPQTKVLPFVDLVITHGGNNTVTETLAFGKPMIVLPLFFDQYDNAQRVQEKGFGVRLDPYLCSEEELLNSIETLLNDDGLENRLRLASNRIQNSDSLDCAANIIESLVN